MDDPREKRTDNMASIIEALSRLDDDQMLTLACCAVVVQWSDQTHKALRVQAEKLLDKASSDLQGELNG